MEAVISTHKHVCTPTQMHTLAYTHVCPDLNSSVNHSAASNGQQQRIHNAALPVPVSMA